ncbi:MAG: response regulator transcription factor [Bacteroidales bacterium]|nr:response regulator transcription factor [Bacteroidales bacterium]
MDRKILIVDDEEDIREILQFNLENAGFEVDSVASAEEALKVLGPDHGLILLDVMMGGMSGYKMAEHLRAENNNVPIIFLTALNAQNDLLTGFSSGADDYITKPFSIQEVIARVRAVLRRFPQVEAAPEPVQENMVVAGALRIDLEKKLVFAGDTQITFSKKEFEVLSLLASHPGQIFSREDLINELWKDAPYVLDRTVDVHIARIRGKLGEYKNCISNRSGFGYVFNVVE